MSLFLNFAIAKSLCECNPACALYLFGIQYLRYFVKLGIGFLNIYVLTDSFLNSRHFEIAFDLQNGGLFVI